MRRRFKTKATQTELESTIEATLRAVSSM